ncbi:2-hydroxyacid dehydrogenase [Pseudorhodobacter aquimaris]|uniref:2-hydroxyacid dehydrogenase n=1 Tax=Pseudorhodobacter aquimaris TaxID=687412 RepID=UPI00067B65B6|nr:glyoxylate/hydroxypyruvate reductase A [Pseudorhodobacter aquimaris]
MITLYFAAGTQRWTQFEAPLRCALQEVGIEADLSPHCADPSLVDYIIYAPDSAVQDFTPFTRCKAVLNLWAGVERIVGNPTLTQPLCRMVDPALTAGMVEWVLGHTLRHHLGMDRHIVNPDHIWEPSPPPLATERAVTILGLGALGQACARALQGVGFPVKGWSRTQKSLPDITSHHGDEGLKTALSGAEIVVLLLPKTAATENIVNAERLTLLAPGAVILNPGRGHLIDDTALLAALDSGALGHATLDVFRIEPLPKDHPFWAHPQVTVTPHIAAETRPKTAARVVVENIRRGQAGLPFLHRVDTTHGY